jgi:hypothetical protein
MAVNNIILAHGYLEVCKLHMDTQFSFPPETKYEREELAINFRYPIRSPF